MNLQEALVKFKELTVKHKSDMITYDWDGGHSYSLLKHTIMDPLMIEVDKLPQLDQYDFEDITAHWMCENEDLPLCYPGGQCECVGIDDVDVIKEFVRTYEHFIGEGAAKKYCSHIKEVLDAIELDEAVDSELSA